MPKTSHLSESTRLLRRMAIMRRREQTRLDHSNYPSRSFKRLDRNANVYLVHMPVGFIQAHEYSKRRRFV